MAWDNYDDLFREIRVTDLLHFSWIFFCIRHFLKGQQIFSEPNILSEITIFRQRSLLSDSLYFPQRQA